MSRFGRGFYPGELEEIKKELSEMGSLTFYGTPVAKGRARVGRWGVFTPKKTRDAENAIKEQFREQYTGKPIEGAMIIKIDFYMPIPKGLSTKKKELLDGGDHTKKPDLDNICKLFLDALNGLLYKDDAQICRMELTKQYSKYPRTQIYFETL